MPAAAREEEEKQRGESRPTASPRLARRLSGLRTATASGFPPRLIVSSYTSPPFNFNDDAIGCLTKEATAKRWPWCVQGIVALKECGGRGLRQQALSHHVIRSYD